MSSPSPTKKKPTLAPPEAVIIQPSSPRFPISGAQRKIGIAIDFSDESSNAVKWAVQNYLRPNDTVFLIHVTPTNILYGADWGSIDLTLQDDNENTKTSEKSEAIIGGEFEVLLTKKVNDLSLALVEMNIPYKIHIVKDHDMKERLCLEVERLGLSAVIMGSRGFGGRSRKGSKRRLGSVSEYCVRHCVCPVVLVRFPEEEKEELGSSVEEEGEFYDAYDKCGDTEKTS